MYTQPNYHFNLNHSNCLQLCQIIKNKNESSEEQLDLLLLNSISSCTKKTN